MSLHNRHILIEFPKDRLIFQSLYRQTASHVIFSSTLISVMGYYVLYYRYRLSSGRRDSPVLHVDPNLGLGTPSATWSSEDESRRSPTLDSSVSNQ